MSERATTDDNGILYFVSANQNQLYINIPKAISSRSSHKAYQNRI